MKKITSLLFIFCSAFMLNTFAYENFEGTPVVVPAQGGNAVVTTNPLKSGINATDNCIKLGRDNQTYWYASVDVDGTDFTLSNNTKKYVHIMMKFDAEPRVYIRAIPQGNVNNFSLNKYTKIGEWQDMVFEIRRSSTEADITITAIRLFFDTGTSLTTSPANMILTDGTKFCYADEIVINDDPTPRGITAESYLSVDNIYNFESTVPSFIKDIRTFAENDVDNLVTYPVENPFTDGINNSLKSGRRNYNTGTKWWSGFDFSFTSPILVDDDNRYLHVMVAVPVDNTEICIDARLLDNNFSSQASNNPINDKAFIITTANVWQDVVVDLKADINTALATAMPFISGISIQCGKNNAMQVGNYYFDEIRIDGDPNPRLGISTSQAGLNKDITKVRSVGNKLIINNTHTNNSIVAVYNTAGQLVRKENFIGGCEITINDKGLYFVNTDGKTTKILIN